ncbi:uncharacterized protein J3R85_006521 [Psidium guajava]|nr:uncharacterized protein J3R85_006521 [Psidium guajava]
MNDPKYAYSYPSQAPYQGHPAMAPPRTCHLSMSLHSSQLHLRPHLTAFLRHAVHFCAVAVSSRSAVGRDPIAAVAGSESTQSSIVSIYY